MEENAHTPLEVIANVSRVVSKVVDQVTGDRVEVPLMVAAAVVEALKLHGIESRVMYGPAAWLEVTEDQKLIWAGCWGKFFHFWAATQFGEVVDLNLSVAHRKKVHSQPGTACVQSPPMLWAREVPSFVQYHPEGVAELELTETRDLDQFNRVLEKIREKCRPELLPSTDEQLATEFPNEAIICPGRRILDDSLQSFRQFDRILSVRGIPPAPVLTSEA